MSRNALVAGAVVLVGCVLWLVTAWPGPGDDAALEPLSEPEAEPEVPRLQPTAAPPAAAAPVELPEQQPTAAPVAAPAVEPLPADQASDGKSPPEDMFAASQGPVDEYKQQYEREPRDSAASDAEKKIRDAFSHPGDGAPDMFKSVLCRQTICKVELEFADRNMGAYIAGITRATAGLDTNIAVAPAGPLRADSVRPIEVYLRRVPLPGVAPALGSQPSTAPAN